MADSKFNMDKASAYAWVTTVFYTLCVSSFGMMCGLITGSITIQSQDGFKGIADLLGFAMGGVIIGLLTGLLTASKLNHRQKKYVSIILAVIVIAFSGWIASEMN